MSAVTPRGVGEPRDEHWTRRLGTSTPWRGHPAVRRGRRRDRLHHRRRAHLGASRRRGRAGERKASADPRHRQSRRMVAAPPAQHHRDRRFHPRHRYRRSVRTGRRAGSAAGSSRCATTISIWVVGSSDQFVYGQTGRHHRDIRAPQTAFAFLTPMIDYLRGRTAVPDRVVRLIGARPGRASRATSGHGAAADVPGPARRGDRGPDPARRQPARRADARW